MTYGQREREDTRSYARARERSGAPASPVHLGHSIRSCAVTSQLTLTRRPRPVGPGGVGDHWVWRLKERVAGFGPSRESAHLAGVLQQGVVDHEVAYLHSELLSGILVGAEVLARDDPAEGGLVGCLREAVEAPGDPGRRI